MGTLTHFDLATMKQKHGLRHIVETGTGIGDSMEFALGFGFETLHTSEIEPSLAMKAAGRLAHRGVAVYGLKSVDFLRMVCPTIPVYEPVLFWLDAHFPGVDYFVRSLSGTTDGEIMLPLETELMAIMTSRRTARDVILIDDLRIYLDGPFLHGAVAPNLRPACPVARNIDFIHRTCGDTHDIQVIYDHEGYALLTPKGV